MGSLPDGDYAKGKDPALAWVQRGVDDFNERCLRVAKAVPLWRKVLSLFGIRGPSYKWQQDHWYDQF